MMSVVIWLVLGYKPGLFPELRPENLTLRPGHSDTNVNLIIGYSWNIIPKNQKLNYKIISKNHKFQIWHPKYPVPNTLPPPRPIYGCHIPLQFGYYETAI